ncbi:MAG: hypothetical protein OXH57_04545 [Ekhidna sp.]|nr:hypothetical protein [Ekhidna sp.]
MSECPDCKCNDSKKYFRILNLVLDNEASDDQRALFNLHIKECAVCFAHYNIELQLRQLIKTKVSYKLIPEELAQEIRSRVID